METQSNLYVNIVSDSVFKKISSALNNDLKLTWAIEKLEFHLHDPRSSKFQKYYFEVINNEDNFLTNPSFFKKFKYQYGLQGISNEYLSNLEDCKSTILKLIKSGQLADLYINYFAKASVRHGNEYRERNLTSFFTKLVHTFLPDEYCPLDNPIKNYFGLKNEGFFISFLVISNAYRKWAAENNKQMTEMKNSLLQMDKKKLFVRDELTNIKVLDLIFWSAANPPQPRR